MSFLNKMEGGIDINTGNMVKQGTEAAKDVANQFAEEGQKIAQEAIDKGCQAAKDAGEKASAQVKCGFKKK